MSGDQLNLDEITERCERAVDGPWTPSLSITGWAVVVGEGPTWVADTIDEATADFIACASEDVPALVAEVRRLREALETIAGDDLDYLGRLRLTDTENAIYVIARDALGRKS